MSYSDQTLHQLSPLLQVNYRKEEAKILDSVMGATVYDSRIRPSGINGTGNYVDMWHNRFPHISLYHFMVMWKFCFSHFDYLFYRYYQTTSSAILGAVLAIIFIALVILAVLIGKLSLIFILDYLEP